MKANPRCHCYENCFGFIGNCPVHDKPLRYKRARKNSARSSERGIAGTNRKFRKAYSFLKFIQSLRNK